MSAGTPPFLDAAQILPRIYDPSTNAIQVEGDITTSNPSDGTSGQPIPSSSNLVGTENPSGNLEPLQSDSSGNLKVNVVAGTISAENPSVSTTSSTVPTYATYLAANQSGNLVGLTSSANGLKIDGSAITQPVSAAALPLPTGAATSANQATEISSLATIASNTANINSAPKGRSTSNAPVYNSYSSTNVTTLAYVQLVASTTSVTNMIEIFDSSGQSLILGVGASGSEVVQLYTLPGGNGQVPLAIPAGSRVAIKALTNNATSGYLVINFYS